LERFLFKKIELWVVLILALLAVLGAVGFGWLALTYGRQPHPKGALADATIAVAEIPDTIKALIKDEDSREANRWQRFGSRSGWTMEKDAPSLAADGYILVSRFSGDEDRSVVELVDLADFQVKYRWLPDVNQIIAGVPHVSNITRFERWSTRMFNFVHPLLLANGDLIVKDHQSPLARVDNCGQMIWHQYADLVHHSTNTDAEGNLWVPTLIDPGNPDYAPQFFQDGITEFSPDDGHVMFTRSLPDLMVKEGYEAMLFGSGAYRDDALHLNDIEVAQSSGPFWQKGDLFLSLRHMSMVILYRPSTDRIIWQKQGPWLAQHDVDIIDDHTIAVFNNNAYDHGFGWYVKGHSDVTFYDFATGKTSTPFARALAEQDLKSLTEGLFDLTTEGNAMVEEQNSGRIVLLGKDGRFLGDYINRARNGKVYDLGWSRYVPRAEGDAALAAIAARPVCK